MECSHIMLHSKDSVKSAPAPLQCRNVGRVGIENATCFPGLMNSICPYCQTDITGPFLVEDTLEALQ